MKSIIDKLKGELQSTIHYRNKYKATLEIEEKRVKDLERAIKILEKEG